MLQFLVNAKDWTDTMKYLSQVQKDGEWKFLNILSQDDTLTITAKNEETNEVCTLEAMVRSAGEICLPYEHVNRIAKHGDRVVEFTEKLEKDEYFCTIKSGKTEYNLKLVQEFPDQKKEAKWYVPDLAADVEASFRIDQSQFRRMLKKSEFNGNWDESRVANICKGIYMLVRDGRLCMIVFSGHTMSIVECEVMTYDELHEFGCVVPWNTVKQLKKRQRERGLWRVTVQNGNASFSINGRVCLSTKTFKPEADNIEKLEKNFKPTNQSCTVWRRNFKEASERMAVILSSRIACMKVKANSDGVMLSTESPVNGKAEEDLDMENEYSDVDTIGVNGDFEFGINYRYLKTVLESLEKDTVEVGFSKPGDPVQFCEDYEGIRSKYIVMPMRV